MNDIEQTIWGYETFQQCVPDEYKHPIAYLVGKYYIEHIDNKAIEKVVHLVNESNGHINKKDDIEKQQIKYVKDNWNS